MAWAGILRFDGHRRQDFYCDFTSAYHHRPRTPDHYLCDNRLEYRGWSTFLLRDPCRMPPHPLRLGLWNEVSTLRQQGLSSGYRLYP